jgi:hypothetical protein
MEIFELIPASQNRREWNRGGYGMCGLDEAGHTWFNPLCISTSAVLLALSSGTVCQMHQIDGEEHMLVRVSWAKEQYPALAKDLDILDSRIRRIAARQPLEQYN